MGWVSHKQMFATGLDLSMSGINMNSYWYIFFSFVLIKIGGKIKQKKANNI